MPSLIFSVLSLCMILGISHGLIKISPEGPLDVTEGDSVDVCAEVDEPEDLPSDFFPLNVSINFEFFTADSTDISPSHVMELKLVQAEEQQCVEIAVLPSHSINATEKTFAIIVSVLDLPSSQCNVTISREGSGIQLAVPAAVEVAEGAIAVLCIEAKFSPTSLAQHLLVKLRVLDISTTLEDFNHSSVPPSLLLAADRPSQCLHIPTYSNEDDPHVTLERFEISIMPGDHRVVVTLLEQGESDHNPTRVRRQDSTPSECIRRDVLPFVGGPLAEEGIVEVSSSSGNFPVDLNTFTILEATVICKELRLGSAGFPLSAARDLGVTLFSQLRNVRGRLAQVQCSGNEACVAQCNVSVLYDQEPRDFAGVFCTGAVQCTDGAARLVPPPHLVGEVPVREGRLEICFHGIWGAVFDTDWSARDALVACRHLGFNSNAKGVVPVVPAIYPNDRGPLPIVYDSPKCSAIPQSLLDCPREQPLCPADQDDSTTHPDLSGVLGRLSDGVEIVGTRAFTGVVGVICPPYEDSPQRPARSSREALYSPVSTATTLPPPITTGIPATMASTMTTTEAPICRDLDVRLSSQTRTTATGNLEVCFENRWLRACNNLFDEEDLNVACRSLGFTAFENSTTAQHRFVTPRIYTSGRPFIQTLNCSGMEEHLSECDRIKEPNVICVSTLSIGCLAPPRVTFNPPVESGIFYVEENRGASLECIVEKDSYPPVTNLTVKIGLNETGGSGVSPPYCLSAPVYSTKRASLEDSGQYSCVVTSGGLVFTHSVQLLVKTPAQVGPVRVADYLRFTVETSLFISPEQEIEQIVYSVLSTDIPGQQEVQCHQVKGWDAKLFPGVCYDESFPIRTPFDGEMERFECAIISFVPSSEDNVPEYLAALAAVLLSRFDSEFYCFQASSSGFCDFERTQFQDTEYSWPEVAGGETYSLPCSVAYDPSQLLTRTCNPARGGWLPVNTSRCRNALDTIKQVLDEQVVEERYEDQVELIAAILQHTVSEQSEQSSGVLDAVASFLDGVAKVALDSNESIPVEVVEGVLESLSSLQQWQPHLLNTSSTSIARITSSFEQSAAHFAEQLQPTKVLNVTIPDQIVFAAENVMMAAVATLQDTGRTYLVRNNTFVQGAFPEGSSGDTNGSIALPSSLFASLDEGAQVGIIFTLYSTGALFPVRPADSASSTAVSMVASPVVAATVGAQLPISNISPPVLVQFRLSPPPSKGFRVNGSERCVWWDFTAVGGQGNWSSDGCTTLTDNTDADIVQCHCTHLTNFAILVDICARLEDCAVEENAVLTKILSFITYIGAAVSMLGLLLSVVTMLAFQKLRHREASKYHIQLCVSLFCMLLVFVCGVEATEEYAGCVTVSALLHYFALTALLWMAAEALFMCKKLTFVFKRNSNNFIIVVSLICWGVPLVPVSIPLVIDLSQGSDPTSDLVIRRDAFCFLSNAVVFWVAFMGPIVAILLMNLVLYAVVVFILLRHMRGTIARRQERISVRTTLRLMASITSILFLFGLTWLFAVLTFTVPELHQTAQILFTAFNSLQGVFLFFFFCVLSLEARESWKEFLSCGRYKSTILHPQLRSNSFDASVHNKLYSGSMRSDKIHIIRTFDANRCDVPTPTLASPSLTSLSVTTPDLVRSEDCVHTTLPVQNTPQDDVTTPTLTNGERQFITHSIPTPPQGENGHAHTLSSPSQGENGYAHTFSAPPQGKNGHAHTLPPTLQGRVTTSQSSAGQAVDRGEVAWRVQKPLGARVKRVSTMTHHVEEYQLDFQETTDEEDKESKL